MFDNFSFIREILDCGKLFDLDFGLISIDQEKALDRIEHRLLKHSINTLGFKSDLNDVTVTSESFGIKSCRFVAKVLENWRLALNEKEKALPARYCKAGVPNLFCARDQHIHKKKSRDQLSILMPQFYDASFGTV